MWDKEGETGGGRKFRLGEIVWYNGERMDSLLLGDGTTIAEVA